MEGKGRPTSPRSNGDSVCGGQNSGTESLGLRPRMKTKPGDLKESGDGKSVQPNEGEQNSQAGGDSTSSSFLSFKQSTSHSPRQYGTTKPVKRTQEGSEESISNSPDSGFYNCLGWLDYFGCMLWWVPSPDKGQVVNAEQVPVEMRESYILTGYRPPSLGVIPSAKSAFYIHNETLNFWTHMIPFLYFAYNLFLDQGPWLRLALISPLGRYPFYGYMVGICSLFGASSFAHLFHCAGRRRWRNVCFVLDYAAISVYGTASAISYYFYSRPRFRGTFIGYLLSGEGHFLGFTTATAWVATWASCLTRLRPSRFCYAIRTAAFALPFIVGSFPALMRWVSAGATLTGSSANEYYLSKLNESEGEILKSGEKSMGNSNYEFPNLDYDFQTPYTRHIVLLAGGAIINVLKIPERFWPGKFDALGSSHQWFHILVFFSIREQFWLMLEEIACHSGMLYLRDPDSSMPWGRATIKPGKTYDAYCTIITSTSYTSGTGSTNMYPSTTSSAFSSSASSFSSSSSSVFFPWNGWGSLLFCALCNPRASLDTWMVLNTLTWMTIILGTLTITIVWFGYNYKFEFTSSSLTSKDSADVCEHDQCCYATDNKDHTLKKKDC